MTDIVPLLLAAIGTLAGVISLLWYRVDRAMRRIEATSDRLREDRDAVRRAFHEYRDKTEGARLSERMEMVDVFNAFAIRLERIAGLLEHKDE